MTWRRALASAVLAAPLVFAVPVLLAVPAAAHPLGLPAFAQVSASGDQVTVSWVAAADDVAALARSIGLGDRSGPLTREQDAELAGSSQLRERALRDVTVRQNGTACAADFVPPASVVTEGFRLVFRCPEAVTRIRLRIALLHDVDSRYRTLAGWTGPDGTYRAMFSKTEPEHDLTLDPSARQQAAPRGRPDDVRGAFGGALPLERRFVAAIDSTPGVLRLLGALLVAFAVGALHALAPGHGKAVAAGYLVGERARTRHAVALGVTVALMHTGSVLALGFALYTVTRTPDTARLSATIGLVTGVTFAALGSWLLVRRWRERRQVHGHSHDHGGHPDHGDHAHRPDRGDHADHADHPDHPDHRDRQGHVQDRPALSLQGVVTLGAAGGLLPSPSAMLVLLTALAAGRVVYGLALIAFFSLGLATTVTLVGVAVLRGRDVLHDRAGARLHGLVHAAPLVGAAAVTAVGAALAIRAAIALG